MRAEALSGGKITGRSGRPAAGVPRAAAVIVIVAAMVAGAVAILLLQRAEEEPTRPSPAATVAAGIAVEPSAESIVGRPDAACDTAFVRLVAVATSAELAAALAGARPGDLIRLADGVYDGRFEITISGEEILPITLCGARDAVLDGGGIEDGYGLHLRADRWVLRGFTVRNVAKGIVLDRASGNVLRDLVVEQTGHEAVHFRTFSRDNTLRDSEIRETGLERARFGEGVYIGSAESNWCALTDCDPDASDDNRILDNVIGPGVTAESIDVKEGTTGGLIRGNTFLGAGMTEAEAWVNVKGNGYLVVGNRGEVSPRDGFQTTVVRRGWGNDNVFAGNVADVRGPGYGFRIAGRDWEGNAVACDNAALNAESGLTNVPCDPAYDGTGLGELGVARIGSRTTRSS